jgi:lipopolysaccharide assembly protein A
VARLLLALLLVAAFCLGAAVGYFNWGPVRFHYLAGEVELPLIAVLLAAFVLGIVVMGLLNLARAFMLGRELKRQQRRVSELEAELKSLRELPLQQPASPAAPASPTRPHA